MIFVRLLILSSVGRERLTLLLNFDKKGFNYQFNKTEAWVFGNGGALRKPETWYFGDRSLNIST